MITRLAVVVALVLAAAGCGQSTSPMTPTPTPSPNGSTVSIVAGASTKTSNAYNPNPISVARGTTVMWMNDDSVTHTATSDGGAWNSGAIAPGASFRFTFQSAGTFTYHCQIHPGMVGTVSVQ